MGVKATTVWSQQLQALASLLAVSVLLGAGLGAALYGAVTAQVLSEAIALRPLALLACAGIQAAALLLAGAVCAWLVARRNPMQTGKRGKGL